MSTVVPKIIQGGMGAAVSNWSLAQAVSRLGQLGVVSGTALDQILARRLQCGDPGGHIRHALSHFPFPNMAQRILDTYFVPNGKSPSAPFKFAGMHTFEGKRSLHELCIAGNFVEVFLARQGHNNPVGINYLEKIQMPHLPSLYGAMLAGVAVMIIGAGIPIEIPGVISALASHQAATYSMRVVGAAPGAKFTLEFNPADFHETATPLDPLPRPVFLPIISSDALAGILYRKSNGPIDGFVIEGPLAGGHNAPPRGALSLTPSGEPIYGPRDLVDLKAMRELGLPFWLAGSYGSAKGLQAALKEGASGIQVGTAFALCVESGLTPDIRRALIRKALAGKARVFTDPLASPTGFPFKVAELEGTLSDPAIYKQRRRLCDLGFMRQAYQKEDGTIGYRCPAEPENVFVAKGGKLEETVGRKCLCNSLVSNVGMPQRLPDGTEELPLVTLGDDLVNVGQFCTADQVDYTAADVVRILLG
jgi:nitronate monooxygenase